MGGSPACVQHYFHQLTPEQRKQHAFVVFNIKNFSYFCSRFGWEMGDNLLAQVLEIAKQVIGPDGVVERMYADTYHLITPCPPCTHDDPDALVQTIFDSFLVKLVDSLFNIDNQQVNKQLYLSFGIVAPPNMDADYHTTVERASMARKSCAYLDNRAFSYEIYGNNAVRTRIKKMDLAYRLTNARHNREFEVYVQPKVNPRTNLIVGGEVLLRWSHADGTPIGTYIDLLQEYAEIYLVDCNLFADCCRYLKEGLDAGQPRVPLSFNLSDVSMSQQNFYHEYFSVVDELQLPTEYVQFEILENIQFDQDGYAKEALDACRERGFHCSLDDFGTGNSSFAFLLNGGINCIKLDRIFFSSPMTEERRGILEHLIKIAEICKVSVVAEGVESQEYVDFLKHTSCDAIQGFYYYRPMPLAQFQSLLDRQAAGEILPQI